MVYLLHCLNELYVWAVLLNQRGQLDLRSPTFGSWSSSGKQRMDKEKLSRI
jgi:hypothetical protein